MRPGGYSLTELSGTDRRGSTHYETQLVWTQGFEGVDTGGGMLMFTYILT